MSFFIEYKKRDLFRNYMIINTKLLLYIILSTNIISNVNEVEINKIIKSTFAISTFKL